MKALIRGVDSFWMTFGRYPSSAPGEMMNELSGSLLTNGAAVEWIRFIDREGTFGNRTVPVDGWGQPIYVRIQPDAKVFVVGSYGCNRVDDFGGCDDIVLAHTNTVRDP